MRCAFVSARRSGRPISARVDQKVSRRGNRGTFFHLFDAQTSIRPRLRAPRSAGENFARREISRPVTFSRTSFPVEAGALASGDDRRGRRRSR